VTWTREQERAAARLDRARARYDSRPSDEFAKAGLERAEIYYVRTLSGQKAISIGPGHIRTKAQM
jgi:hypothetical protein